MASDELIMSPDGDRWSVSRQWVKGPKFRWGIRRKPRLSDLENIEPSPLDFIDSPSAILAGLAFFAALVIAFALGAFVILPLLGIALEFAVVLLLLVYGIGARVIFRRPWVIEARNLDNPARSRDLKVVGWQNSRQAVPAIQQFVAAGGDLDSPGAAAIGQT